jgi:hypothetical protein
VTDYTHCPVCLDTHNSEFRDFCKKKRAHVICAHCQINGGDRTVPLLPVPEWLLITDDSRYDAPKLIFRGRAIRNPRGKGTFDTVETEANYTALNQRLNEQIAEQRRKFDE